MLQSMFPQFAPEGAARVRDFHEGLRATHEGAPAHTTTIGHSYASVRAGHAAGNGSALNTDDVLFIGSWGTGAGHVDELSLTGVPREQTRDHFHAVINSSDYVH
jgi:hypothetical protein